MWNAVPSSPDFSFWLPDPTMTAEGFTLRSLDSPEEYRACVGLQEEVWGKEFSEKVPPAILMLANRLSGVVAGAFDVDGGLQGFVFGLTGVMGGEVVHWSDTLAVRRGLRDQGIGTRLKLYQREVLLGRGVRRMHWTFDPLQGRNAHMNLAKLGIVCREYLRNVYGESESPLHRGVGTDRLVAIWEMDSARVEGRTEGILSAPSADEVRDLPRALSAEYRSGMLEPGLPVLDLGHARVLLAVPEDLHGMMGVDLPLAARWREMTRKAFLHYLPRGYEVREFVREGPTSSYVLVDRNRDESDATAERGRS